MSGLSYIHWVSDIHATRNKRIRNYIQSRLTNLYSTICVLVWYIFLISIALNELTIFFNSREHQHFFSPYFFVCLNKFIFNFIFTHQFLVESKICMTLNHASVIFISSNFTLWIRHFLLMRWERHDSLFFPSFSVYSIDKSRILNACALHTFAPIQNKNKYWYNTRSVANQTAFFFLLFINTRKNQM